MKKIENLIKSKGVHLMFNDNVSITYVGKSECLFSVLLTPSIHDSSCTYKFVGIESHSEKFGQKYSYQKVLDFCKKDINEYEPLLLEFVKLMSSIRDVLGLDEVLCKDSMIGIQNFYDMEGNYITSGSNIFDESDIELLKEVLKSFE